MNPPTCLDAMPDTLTVPDMAAIFQVCAMTILRWRDAGTLPPPLRLGRCLRWSKSDITAFLSNHSKRPA